MTPGSGPYNGSTTVTGTLINTYTNQPVPNEPVTLKVNNTQSCTATTNASGVASCAVTPTEPPGTYSLTGSFGGDTSTTPVLLSSSGSSTFVETKAPTTVTYTGSTSTTTGQPPNLSATLTTSSGTPLPGQTVTFTVGTGRTAQSCSATTNSAGKASCSICSYNQSASPLPVTVTYGGNTYYSGSSTTQSVTVVTPTTLSVSATTATYGQPVTLTGTLTNSVTGQGISGQTITLTLNGTQTCTATTASYGKGSCSVTPTEPSGTYPVTGTFGGNTSTSPQLLGQQRLQQGGGERCADQHRLHRRYLGDQRPVADPVGHADEQRDPAGQPARHPDGRHRQDGAELHGHDQLVGLGLVRHPIGEPGLGHGDGHRLVRRQLLLCLVE